MLTMGTALRVVTDWAGDPAKVRSYGVRFASRSRCPTTPRVRSSSSPARVTKVADGVATVAIDALCDGVKVLRSPPRGVR